MTLHKPSTHQDFENNLEIVSTALQSNPDIFSITDEAPAGVSRNSGKIFVYVQHASAAASIPADLQDLLQVIAIDDMLSSAVNKVESITQQLKAGREIDSFQIRPYVQVLFYNIHIPRVREILGSMADACCLKETRQGNGPQHIVADSTKVLPLTEIAAGIADGFIDETGTINYPRIEKLSKFVVTHLYKQGLDERFFLRLAVKITSIIDLPPRFAARLWLARLLYETHSLRLHNERAYNQAVAIIEGATQEAARQSHDVELTEQILVKSFAELRALAATRDSAKASGEAAFDEGRMS